MAHARIRRAHRRIGASMRQARSTVAIFSAFLLLALVSITAAPTDNWTQFRGPDAGVASDDPALTDTWSETDNVIWKAAIPGMGWSAPVVWGDHVIVPTALRAG